MMIKGEGQHAGACSRQLSDGFSHAALFALVTAECRKRTHLRNRIEERHASAATRTLGIFAKLGVHSVGVIPAISQFLLSATPAGDQAAAETKDQASLRGWQRTMRRPALKVKTATEIIWPIVAVNAIFWTAVLSQAINILRCGPRP